MEKQSSSNWHILFVRGGHEKQIVNNIHNSLKKYNVESQVSEIKILEGPNKAGKVKNLLPSYLFVNCIMSREILKAFYSTQGVISFLNHDKRDIDSNPVSLSILEANNFLSIGKKQNSAPKNRSQEQTALKSPLVKSPFETGALILIKEGFFKEHRGLVIKVDPKKGTLTINIDFFGRLTPVSVKFEECEKL